MRAIATADCETDPFDGETLVRPFIWGFYDGNEYREYTDTVEFVEYVKTREVIVYAHNGGKFDWHYILSEIPDFSPLMVINGRLSKFKIGLAEFRDSWNILPVPLRTYKKDDFDYSRLKKENRDDPVNRALIQSYLKGDCVYLYELVSRFVDEYGSNLTVAGTAMKVWENMSGYTRPDTSAEYYHDMAQYYYGGRVECFEKGVIEKKFKVIDINSAYPFAMMEDHPYGDDYITRNDLPSENIGQSFVRLYGVSRGALPFRDKNGLTFPDDRVAREYFVTGWEYLAAVETDTLHDFEIISVREFSDTINFSPYVNHFYQVKAEAKGSGDKAAYIMAKLFLNSLYGKYAANPEKYDEHIISPPEHIEALEQEHDYGYCGSVEGRAILARPISDTKHRYYNIAVAASITGFVRAYLWRAIRKCEGVMYCDTDSIACESHGSLQIDGDTLGAWDIEAVCDMAAIAGKKLYAFRQMNGKWKTASKGARLTPIEIVRVALGETVTYNPMAPTYSLHRGIRFIPREIRRT